jgi:hypothetical protein
VQFVAKGLVVIVAVSAGDVSTRVSALLERRRDQALAKGGKKLER